MAVQNEPVEQTCGKCGGTDLSRDAWARWNATTQAWEVADLFKFAFCHSCIAKTPLVERVMELAR